MIYYSTHSHYYLWYLISRGKQKEKETRIAGYLQVAQNVPTTIFKKSFFKLVLFFLHVVTKRSERYFRVVES